MTNRPKAIGTAAEMAVVRYLEAQGAEHIYRPALQGTLDRGDVHYRTREGLVIISVKGGRMAETASPECIRGWLLELDAQADRVNPNANRFLVTKRTGVGETRTGLWRAHALHVPAVGAWSTDLHTMYAFLA